MTKHVIWLDNAVDKVQIRVFSVPFSDIQSEIPSDSSWSKCETKWDTRSAHKSAF